MSYARFGGVCLILIAALALTLGGLAQTPGGAQGPGSAQPADDPFSETQERAPLVPQSSIEESDQPIDIATPQRAVIPVGQREAEPAAPEVTDDMPPVTEEVAPEAAPEEEVVAETPAEVEQETVDLETVEQETAVDMPPVTEEPAPVTAEETAEEAQEEAETQSVEAAQAQEAPVEEVITPDMIPQVIEENQTADENETVEEDQPEEVEAEPVEEEEEEDLDETSTIWREGESPEEYTWTPQNFAGFFYDMDEDVGTEELKATIDVGDRSIAEGDLRYETEPQPIDFEFDEWGEYSVIGFMAEKYFAGYEESTDFDLDEIDLINEEQLREVLIDSDEENSITSGSVLPLEEGYELRIEEIDVQGDRVFMSLARDGDEVDSQVIGTDTPESSTFRYDVDIGGEDVPIIMIHVDQVFQGVETSIVTVDGIFQISDDFVSVENGDEYGVMEVQTTANGIRMENEDDINLGEGNTEEIFGDVSFVVADDEELRFGPVVERTGSYEIRGAVINPSDYEDEPFEWNPYNFAAFYYDIDDDIVSETLTARFTDGGSIDEGGLEYLAEPVLTEFEFDDWGEYNVIGFLAEKYFAGYIDEVDEDDEDEEDEEDEEDQNEPSEGTRFTDEFNLISEGELRQVLIDSDEEQTLASGSVLPLEEDYELRIGDIDISGDQVFLSLVRDGREVDTQVVTPDPDDMESSTFTYDIEISSEDVPIIAVHVDSVFRGVEADLATIDGIFQISDDPASVEDDDEYGIMVVQSTDNGIRMENEDDEISLGRGDDIDIMENIILRVSDSSPRRVAPIVLVTEAEGGLRINVPTTIMVDTPVEILVRADGQVASGAEVAVDGESIGRTNLEGAISYTPEETGAITIAATLEDYNEARARVQVTDEAAEAAAVAAEEEAAAREDVLDISAPGEVALGETFVIAVTANMTPVEEATITFDDEVIGNTSDQGTLTHSSNETGEHEITASKEGYEDASQSITVLSLIQVVSLETDDETVQVGDSVEIRAEVQNTGTAPETRTLDLMEDGEVVASEEVEIEPGESTTATFSYRPEEAGIHRLSIDGQELSINAEEREGSGMLIALLLILLLIIGAGAYLYKTGELEKIRQRMGR